MTTFIDFVPSAISAPEYQITLDDAIYRMTVTWNLFGQRYYINIFDLSNNLILSVPLIGSPIGNPVQGVSWLRGQVTLTTSRRLDFQIGQIVRLTISGMTPAAYNGTFECFVTGSNSIVYSVADDPGEATVLGDVENNIDLVGEMFTSTLIYRAQNRQFEVSE